MPVPHLVPVRDAPAEPVVRTLLMTDLVDSTRMVAQVGDTRASEISSRHDRTARDLLSRFRGTEIDKTDGFLLLFERPIDAVAYALAYHRALADLSRELGRELRARAGIHLGEVVLRENPRADVARGAKPLEVEGLAKPTVARLTSLAGGGQTLLTHSAFDLARRSAVGAELPSRGVSWLAHGPYRFKGVEEPLEVFEVGALGLAPLAVPPDSEKASRVVAADDELTLGWRPAPGLQIPLRPNWALLERVGAGGFGEVWLARQRKTGQKRVFKFCLEARRLRSLQREVTLFRLLKETLGHRDDIARVLDWNFDEAPYFLESEYTEGGSLVEWAEERGGLDKVPLAERLELVAQVAEALGAAHSVGVLHKDVKPANVLVRTDPEGRPKAQLTDFGIGLVMDESVLSDRGITMLGMTEALSPAEASATGGTFLYMAPEVIEGKVATVQADLYALGVMLYQMVAGDLSHPLAAGWRRDVPDEILADDVARLVDGSPERRPASAAEVADGLRRLEERREALAARRARDRAQRRWKLVGSIGAVATVVLVVVSILAVQAMQARREAERRQGQAEDLISFMLLDLREKLRALGRLEILDEVGDKALAYFASVPATDLTDEEVFSRSRALMQIGQLRIWQGRPEDARPAFEESLSLVEGLVRQDPERGEWQDGLGERHYWIGRLLWDQGDLDGALERFRLQLAAAHRHAELEPADAGAQLGLARAHNNVGFYLRERGDLEAALEAFRTALAIKQAQARQDPEGYAAQVSLAHGHNALGSILLQLGELGEALASFQAEQAIVRRLLEQVPDHGSRLRQLAVNHNFVGLVREARGEPDEARRQFGEALAIFERLVALDPANTDWQRELATTRRKLGLNLRARGEHRAAVAQLRQAVETMESLVATDPSRSQWLRDLEAARLELGEALGAGSPSGRGSRPSDNDRSKRR